MINAGFSLIRQLTCKFTAAEFTSVFYLWWNVSLV